eukprot:Opistho-2@5744
MDKLTGLLNRLAFGGAEQTTGGNHNDDASDARIPPSERKDFGGAQVQQFASGVVNFSSQYGINAYGVKHIVGPPSVYPHYGDRTDTLVLRTYGPWWLTCPSAVSPLKHRPPEFHSYDFVTLAYETPVYVTEIKIFETYHPGTVVRIVALGEKTDAASDMPDMPASLRSLSGCPWQVLYRGDAGPRYPDRVARIFSPQLQRPKFAAKIFHFEFDSRNCDYYTEIDAIEVIGLHTPPPATQPYAPAPTLAQADASPMNEIAQLSEGLSFADLPIDIARHIFSFLNHRELCRVSRTCAFMRSLAYDTISWADTDLQPYSFGISDESFANLVETRLDAFALKRLSLSWLNITSVAFVSAMRLVGNNLRCLRLACCPLVDWLSLLALPEYCRHLEELDLQGAVCPSDSFLALSPLPLRRLNLYRTSVNTMTLVTLLPQLPLLQHLNIGQCAAVDDCTQVAVTIAESCPDIRSLDFWRLSSLDYSGINAIANSCPRLEELDCGWCGRIDANSGCLANLARSCPNLKKVFLTAVRNTRAEDIESLAQHCKGLRQLDILGCKSGARAIAKVFQNCPDLEFIDLSFCGVESSDIDNWRASYPAIAVKSSFT